MYVLVCGALQGASVVYEGLGESVHCVDYIVQMSLYTTVCLLCSQETWLATMDSKQLARSMLLIGYKTDARMRGVISDDEVRSCGLLWAEWHRDCCRRKEHVVDGKDRF